MILPPRATLAFRPVVWLSLCLALSACDQADLTDRPVPAEPGVMEATRDGPPGAAPGTCWGRTVSPAVIESVVEQVQIAPAKINPDGTIAQPPVYRTETHQKIVTPRTDDWFETPCPETLTKEFIASLQRALQARGLYAASISGEMDEATRSSIRRFQAPTGPDSGVLSLAAARQLGLVAVPRSGESG